jgi:hypothetical protein
MKIEPLNNLLKISELFLLVCCVQVSVCAQFTSIKEGSLGSYYDFTFEGSDSVVLFGYADAHDHLVKFGLDDWSTFRTDTLSSTVKFFAEDFEFNQYALSDEGVIYYSEDYYITMDSLTTVPFVAGYCELIFLDDSSSVIATDDAGYKQIFHSSDTCQSWTEHIDFQLGGQSLAYDNDTVFLQGDGGVGISLDKGVSWSTLFNIIGPGRSLRDIYKKDNKYITVGQGYSQTQGINFGSVLSSNDYGQTWQETQFFGLNRINDLEMLNDSVGYIVGRSQGQPINVYKTLNGGQSWEPVIFTSLPTLTYNIEKIKCLNADTCVLCGSPGLIAITTNGGGVNLNVSELSSNSLSIYPNPSTSIFNIASENTIQSFQVLDQLGKVVLTKEVNEKHIQVDLSGYSKGIYYIKVEFNNIEIVKKLIIQ